MAEETKSTIKKRDTSSSSSSSPSPAKEVKETKSDTKGTTSTKNETRAPRKPVNSFCIRLGGFAITFIVTFLIWSIFNINNSINQESSFYIKEMPAPLLRHFQSGQTIPVFDKSTGSTFNLFIVQNGLNWDREVLTEEEQAVKQKQQSQNSYTQISDPENFVEEFTEPIPQTNSIDYEVALLLHGQTTTSFAFRKTISYIQKERIHPIAIDLPCFGFSDPLSNCTYDEIADRIDDILDSLQIRKPIHLVLYDTGAIIGSLFTLKHSNRVKSVTYIDPHVDLSHTPFYYNIVKTPYINQLFLNLVTSPYISSIRYKYLDNEFSLKNGFSSKSDVDSYFYTLRYKNNINNFIDTIVKSDTSFKTTYKITTSPLALNREFKPIHLIITSKYTPTYQSELFQQKFSDSIRHTDATQTFSLFFEDNPSSISLQLADIVDNYFDKNLRTEKQKPKQPQQQPSNHNGHGHSHGAGNSHGHSHGAGNSHGHSHGGGNSHGHSHGEGSDNYGLGHNYGM